MKKKTTWILALVLLVLLVRAGTLYLKLAAKQAGSQLQAEAKSTAAAESPAAEGQDSIASKAGAESTAEGSSEALTAAPDFTVQEADGTVHKLSEYKGKPIVLNLFISDAKSTRQLISDNSTHEQWYAVQVRKLRA